jgi:hypothetical protein
MAHHLPQRISIDPAAMHIVVAQMAHPQQVRGLVVAALRTEHLVMNL